MRKIVLIGSFLIASLAQSQILKPVKWYTSVNKISGTEYELVAIATIDKGWHLYSQSVSKDGPVPTSFTFEGNKNYLKKGNTTEEKGHTTMDPVFNMQIKYFENKAVFKQRIKVRTAKPFLVKGTVTFMVCDDSRCLPPTDVDLVFNIN